MKTGDGGQSSRTEAEEGLPMDLFSSGESDFFSAVISGGAFLKSLFRKVICWMITSSFVRIANLST